MIAYKNRNFELCISLIENYKFYDKINEKNNFGTSLLLAAIKDKNQTFAKYLIK